MMALKAYAPSLMASPAADDDGRVEFTLPRENSFGMWRYKVEK